MGGIEDLLKSIGVKNTKAVEIGEKMMGAVSSCISYYNTAKTAMELLSILKSDENNALKDLIDELKTHIDGLIEQVIEVELKAAELERNRDLAEYIVPSRNAATIAVNYLIDPAHYDITDAYSKSLDAVNLLSEDSSFRRVFRQKMAGYIYLYGGYVDPYASDMDIVDPQKFPMDPPDPTWDYVLVLPLLIEAISCHLIVIRALEPESYAKMHEMELQKLATRIFNIHNKILESIQVIVPLEKEVGTSNNWYRKWMGNSAGYDPCYSWMGFDFCFTPQKPNAFGLACDGIKSSPYGAIDVYSTLYTMGYFPSYYFPKNPLMLSGNEINPFPEFYTKFAIRSLKQKMNLYKTLNLYAVWNVYVTLKKIVGEHVPLPQEILWGWSIRTVANAVKPYNVFQPGPNNEISVRKLMSSIHMKKDGMYECYDGNPVNEPPISVLQTLEA